MQVNKTAIIILNYNNYEDTINCLESIKKFNNVDQFTDHLIDWHSRMYPDSLKANNFEEYWKGIQITPKYKYNSENPNYKQELLRTRPGVKKRINFYRKQQGLPLLTYINNINDNYNIV